MADKVEEDETLLVLDELVRAVEKTLMLASAHVLSPHRGWCFGGRDRKECQCGISDLQRALDRAHELRRTEAGDQPESGHDGGAPAGLRAALTRWWTE